LKKFDWQQVWPLLQQLIKVDSLWRADQENSLAWISERLQVQTGVLIADEVGLGKTRLSIALAVCVVACGGRVAIMIPPGLTYQWCDEELQGFLSQLEILQLLWVPKNIKSKVLRTYPDIFGTDKNPSSYPLSGHASIIFISHRFGLAQLQSVKRAELLALPFLLKSKLVLDGRRVRGAKKLDVSKAQEAAVNWLHQYAKKYSKLHQFFTQPGQALNTAFNVEANEVLFRNLIGELIGDFELVIIDEAHKSRAGAECLTVTDKKTKTMIQSRMSACLNDILMHPGSASKRAKRVALTATPMEMDAEQWSDIFYRIGLPKKEVEQLKKTVKTFAEAVKNVKVGSLDELKILKDAAKLFQEELKLVVTRRVWRDHPSVKEFSEYSNTQNVAHPHRKIHEIIVPFSNLAPIEKLNLAYAEGLASASRGIHTQFSFKSAGSRHSQGLPMVSESIGNSKDCKNTDVESFGTSPESIGEYAKRQRQIYWLDSLNSLSEDMGRVSESPRWHLQWHPKVRNAITLIERLTGEGRKVLVFGEFIEPIRALDRALNIRHYLRHVRDGKPIPTPVGVKTNDPDVLRWQESADIGFSPAQKKTFVADAEKLSLLYSKERADLRKLCSEVAVQFLKNESLNGVILSPNLINILTTFLVQQLCVIDLPDPSVDGNEIEDTVKRLLFDLKDADPAGAKKIDDIDAEVSFNWDGVIQELSKELERDNSGNFVFRMSPFSQLLFGDTKASTRRVKQSTFNHAKLNPQVLIGQSAVASEGLNLHRACRTVVLFHLDWNPGRIEQQIGRVDRQDSKWMADFESWNRSGDAPHIDIHTISIAGTYDAYRTSVVHERAKILRSQLFGEILSTEQLNQLDEKTQAAICEIKIDFRPPAAVS
jgi:hypothetical protein